MIFEKSWKSLKILTFLEKPCFFVKIHAFWWNAWHCAHLPIARRRLRRELEAPGVSGSRFPTGTHALDALESFRNRLGNFYFSWKNHDFRKIMKIHENHWKSIDFGLYGSSRVAGRWLLGRSERSPRGGGIGPPGAVGVAESRNASGMSTVMSIQVFMAIGGPQIDFFRPKMSHFLNKIFWHIPLISRAQRRVSSTRTTHTWGRPPALQGWF